MIFFVLVKTVVLECISNFSFESTVLCISVRAKYNFTKPIVLVNTKTCYLIIGMLSIGVVYGWPHIFISKDSKSLLVQIICLSEIFWS